MFNKRIVFVLIFVLFSLGISGVSFAQVNLDAVYSSDRFQPSDMFHAGCENEIDVVFELEHGKINGINAVLKYKNEDIKITKILSKGDEENKLNYNISDDIVTFTKLKSNTGGVNRVVFQLFLKGDSNLKKTNFEFETGSYIVDMDGNMIDINDNYVFDFESVPECDPDVVSPDVELLYPVIETGENIALNSYFQFRIADDGKGINKNSINMILNQQKYDISDMDYDWDGDILTIYPETWLPIGSDILFEIIVEDKQVYGKSNVTDKKYKFKTSTGLNFLDDIGPIEFRKIVEFYKDNVVGVYSGACDVLSGGIDSDLTEDNIVVANIGNGFSVFAVLGWIVAGLLLFIRLFSLFVGHKKD